jgi:hypothetical protein
MFNDWEAFDQAANAYKRAFGEEPPLIEMPGDPSVALDLIRDALASGKAFVADVPDGAVI